MATIDSGTETLFSDDSPCELPPSPSFSGEDAEVQVLDSTTDVNNRLAPPNIQPYSGVLEKVSGKGPLIVFSVLKCTVGGY